LGLHIFTNGRDGRDGGLGNVLAQPPLYERPNWPAQKRPVELKVFVQIAIQEQDRGRPVRVAGTLQRNLGKMLAQFLVQTFQAVQQQFLFVPVVPVKGDARRVGPIRDVLNGDLFVGLLQHEFQKGASEPAARSGSTPVLRLHEDAPENCYKCNKSNADWQFPIDFDAPGTLCYTTYI